ncbi:hypothetical protein CHH83_23260 [Bacillus sp. 7586-K]|nr:hypothetical protein CHH83_23260 [Bacillus sp. 7586-K]
MGYVPLGKDDTVLHFQIISSVMNKKSLIITSYF